MSKIKKVDIDIEDLKVDCMFNFKTKLEKSYNFSKTFLWLGINFINNQKTSVTAQDLSRDLFQNYTYSYILLNSFTSFGILKKIKRSKQTLFVCINNNVFDDEYINLAKELVNGRNK